MCVKVKLVQRFGNNLFQYALARIVAEHHGFALHCTQVPFVGGPHRLLGAGGNPGPATTFAGLAADFPDAPLDVPGREYDDPVERYEIGRDNPWKGHTLDLEAVLADPTPRQIRFHGFFQRYEFFAAHRDRLRRWFRPRPVPSPWAITPRDVLVSIRRGSDYGVKDWTLSLAYYERILDGLRSPGRVYVCGVGIDDAVRRRLARFHPLYFDATAIEHFAFMMRFQRIVLSNSTFAWWAAFLSDADEVYAPRSGDGRAYGFTGWEEEEVDLHTREPRYIEVVDSPLARFAPFSLHAPASAAVIASLDIASRELWTWMAAQRDPIELRDVQAHHRHLDLRRAIERLSTAGLLSMEDRYIDTEMAVSTTG